MSDQEYTPETLRALFTDLDWNAESQYAVRWLAARVLPHADAWRKQLEAAKAREEAEDKDTGLRYAEALARRLYRIVKHPDNAGVGKISLHYQEPDGSIGVVLVLAPDKGNAAIIEAIEAIYDKQDEAASEAARSSHD